MLLTSFRFFTVHIEMPIHYQEKIVLGLNKDSMKLLLLLSCQNDMNYIITHKFNISFSEYNSIQKKHVAT